ncbi:hypothetical protein DFP73DRAFT_553010 [Morchella snyderi]|nr:hypothetical protein DFP73DRAFT_553010 [Morchella snyderi]
MKCHSAECFRIYRLFFLSLSHSFFVFSSRILLWVGSSLEFIFIFFLFLLHFSLLLLLYYSTPLFQSDLTSCLSTPAPDGGLYICHQQPHTHDPDPMASPNTPLRTGQEGQDPLYSAPLHSTQRLSHSLAPIMYHSKHHLSTT